MYWFILRPIDCLMRSMYVQSISFYFTTSHIIIITISNSCLQCGRIVHIREFQISFDKIDLWLACLFLHIVLLSIAIYGQCNGIIFLRCHHLKYHFEAYEHLWWFFPSSLLFSSCVLIIEWSIQLRDINILRFKSIQINRKKEHNFGSSIRLSMRLRSENGNRSSIVRGQ